jgi:hypothetical protein
VPKIETPNPQATPLRALRVEILALDGLLDESTNESRRLDFLRPKRLTIEANPFLQARDVEADGY